MATILPPPLAQWIDASGNPLAGGKVYTYVPGTLTNKTTWQNSGQTVANTNPIILDASGRAIIYGSGTYRFRVFDADDNLVYDQITADTAVGGNAWGGVSTGTVNAQVCAASSFSQQDGQVLYFIAGLTNTGPMTLDPGGGGAIAVLVDTSSGPAPLAGGEVAAGDVVGVLYEAARGAFHLITPAAPIADIVAAFHPATAGSAAALDLAEATANGSNAVALTVPANLSAARTITLPDASGTTMLLETPGQSITGGATVPGLSLGTITAGTLTLSPGNRPMQYYTNGGAHTLAPGVVPGYIVLDITNNASAGTITTSGWTKVVGVFTATNGDKFRCSCSIGDAGSLLSIQAMQ